MSSWRKEKNILTVGRGGMNTPVSDFERGREKFQCLSGVKGKNPVHGDFREIHGRGGGGSGMLDSVGIMAGGGGGEAMKSELKGMKFILGGKV